MSTKDNVLEIIDELLTHSKTIDEVQLSESVKLILEADRIFVGGAGRSGFVGRAFANRLMHLGLDMFFVGDATTPSIREGDVLFIISGSGNTAGFVNNARVAKKEKAKIITMTIFPENTIGQLADLCVVLAGCTYKADNKKQVVSKQLLGSMFEQLSWISCDAIAMELGKKLNQTSETMQYRHANME
ncbi:MAG: 6-phospho-3-hexuloisomerase [Breznakia sp.]